MSEVRTAPKRLVDLNPKWIETSNGDIYGIGYDCPCGLPCYTPEGGIPLEQCCKVGGRQTVPTKSNWLGRPSSAYAVTNGWDLRGGSFENVVLSPSINAVGHWHGFLGGASGESPGVLVSC